MKFLSTCCILISLLIVAGCVRTHKVSPEDFTTELEMGNVQTMHYSEFLCIMDSNAYLRVMTMSSISPKKWRTKIIYTPLADLSQDLQNRLIEEDNEFRNQKEMSTGKDLEHAPPEGRGEAPRP